MTPNFLVIGAPKCGTTSLYYCLLQHPEIYLPVQKELHYFSYRLLSENANGPGDAQIVESLCPDRDKYEEHFDAVNGEKAIGDVSPSYLYYSVQDRIRQEIGIVKIVVILRDPLEKAYSQYMHLVRDQRETLSFYESLLAEDWRAKQKWSDIWRYAESSLYAERLQKYIECFGRENVHVIVFDEFFLDAEKELKSLFKFLGVDEGVYIETGKKYNRTGRSRSSFIANFLNRPNLVKALVKRATPDAWRIALRLKIMDLNTAEKEMIDNQSEEYLRKYFENDILELEKLINKKLHWN